MSNWSEANEEEDFERALDFIRQGEIEHFRELPSKDFSLLLNMKVGDGKTLLSASAKSYRKRISKLLLKLNARLVLSESERLSDEHLINYDIVFCVAQSMAPLHILAFKNQLSLLLEIFDEFESSITSVFNKSDMFMLALYLIPKDDCNGLEHLISSDASELSIVLQKDAAGFTFLYWSACLSRLDCTKKLLDALDQK